MTTFIDDVNFKYKRLRFIFDNSTVIFYTSSIDNIFNVKDISNNVFNILGYEPKEIINNPDFIKSIVHPDDLIDYDTDKYFLEMECIY